MRTSERSTTHCLLRVRHTKTFVYGFVVVPLCRYAVMCVVVQNNLKLRSCQNCINEFHFCENKHKNQKS